MLSLSKIVKALFLACIPYVIIYLYFHHPYHDTKRTVIKLNKLIERSETISTLTSQKLTFSPKTVITTILPTSPLKFTTTSSLLSSLNVRETTEATETPDDDVNDTEDETLEKRNLTLCPVIPPQLKGPLSFNPNSTTFEKIAMANPGLQPGGRYKPLDCIARHRVAIVIPYRDRKEHLGILLANLHPMLMRQQLDYGIFVIDQDKPWKFNRAMLMNIGYNEAIKRYDYQCFIFHDVDLIPENDKNIYACSEQPRHLAAAVDKFDYRLIYKETFGGVSAINKKVFEKLNGYSNLYFGWGGEDDDMSRRIRTRGYKISRYPLAISRYRMIKHKKDAGNPKNIFRHGLLRAAQFRRAKDGLNTLEYTIMEEDVQPTHHRIKVSINKTHYMKEILRQNRKNITGYFD